MITGSDQARPLPEDAAALLEPSHLLVIDDDRRLRELLSRYLAEQGFRVTTAQNAAEARARLRGLDFDLLIVDVMMPGESGLDLTRALRATNPVPILMLTAMDAPEDRIAGLEGGADDYLAKPFEPRELLLRIRRILERVTRAPKGGTIRFGACSFDLRQRALVRDGEPVHLTTAEATLLEALARRGGVPMGRDVLRSLAGEGSSDRAIDVQIMRLRRKIEDNPAQPRHLQTVRGQGYVLLTE